MKINEYAESQLVYKVFHIWSRKYAMVKQMQELEVHVQEFKERYLKARVFQLWNGQLRLKISLDIKCLKMRRYHEKTLKRKRSRPCEPIT